MNTFKKLIAVGVIAVGVLSACGEKKTKENHDHSHDSDSTPAVEQELSEDKAKLRAAKERVADSLRKVDSLRQVKEHGHAH